MVLKENMKIITLKIKENIFKVTFFFVILLNTSCSLVEQRLQVSDQDFCVVNDEIIEKKLSTYLLPIKAKMEKQTGVYVLEEGIEAMLSRAWLTDHAEQSIDVQYFIFSADKVGLIATDYLVRAADRGVKIRVLVDDIMVEAQGDELIKLAAHKNISIKIYNPTGKNIMEKLVNLATDFHGINQRMHNKAFIVDSNIVITGGRNVANEYFGYDDKYNFRDRDVLVLGKAASDVERSFEQFWNSELSISVEELVSDSELRNVDVNFESLHQYACNPKNFSPLARDKINDIPQIFQKIKQTGKFIWLDGVEYISDLPGKNKGETFLGGGGISTQRLIKLVQQAKKSVTIQTPYLITTNLGKKMFKELVKKGVEVKILTNSLASTDNLEAFSGYQRDRIKLLKTGVEIYEFRPDAKIRRKIMSEVMQQKLDDMPIFGLHAKSMVIDDKISVIGTFNLDPRSANLNTESITIIPSQEISKSIKQGMVIEMKPENAWHTTLEWNPDSETSLLKQLRVKLRKIVPKNIL